MSKDDKKHRLVRNQDDKVFKFLKNEGKNKKVITYFKSENELEQHEWELLYGEFTQQWQHLPLKLQNKFLRWLLEESKRIIKKEK